MIGRSRLRPTPEVDERPSRGPGVVVALTVEDDLDVDGPRWAKLLGAALDVEGIASGAEAGLSFVAPDAMTALNTQHMGSAGPTDVLAFPIDGRDAAGADSSAGAPGLVGDVVICPAVAATAAFEHAGSVDDELALLVVHGALHLLGHDHAEVDERARMQAREAELLAQLHGPLAGDPWAEA